MKRSRLETDLGWRSRGYLPHFDDRARTQFVTARLFDSMPQSVLARWKRELENGTITDAALRRRIETYLDQGYGACFLRDERIAEMVVGALRFHAGALYDLHAYCVMPNHIHFMFTPRSSASLARISHSIRSYTAHEANRILERTGSFWNPEPFDRFIRNERHFAAVARYIEENPVKARLCSRPEDWKFSSAFDSE